MASPLPDDAMTKRDHPRGRPQVFNLIESRIGRRLLVMALAVSLAPLIIVSLAWSSQSHAAIDRETHRTLTAVADGAEAAVLEYVHYLKSRARDFASDGFIRDSLQAICSKEGEDQEIVGALNEHLAVNKLPLFPECVELWVVDASGRIVASSTASRVGQDRSQSEVFLCGRQSTYVSDVFRQADAHDIAWFVSTPLLSREGHKLSGVLVCRLNPESLSDVVTGRRAESLGAATQYVSFGHSCVTYIVNRDGLMITESPFVDRAVLNQYVDTEPVRLAIEHGQEMAGHYRDYRGILIAGSSMLIPELGWVILAEIDFSEAFIPVAQMRSRMVVLGAGLALAAILASAHLTAKVVKPLQALTLAADRMRTGDLGARANVESRDETGSLATAFNQMAAKLEGQAKNQEALVRERTADLCAEVAEHERTQVELRRALKSAKAAATAKSDFLANMSHEIRTPMTAILGFAENMLDPTQSDSERLNCIHTIRRNGEYLLGIINDILDLSKIEAGKMDVDQVACEPCRIVAEVVSLMRVQSDAKKLSFNIEYIGAIPKAIRNDPIRLRQILINLIGNAIKFTEAGGVRLVTRFVEDFDQPRLQFDVIDTGRGMTKKQVSKLFRPFTQADTSTTRKFGGTGLGLTISQRFAELLGGNVTVVETEVNRGTTVRATVATGPLEGVKMLQDPMSATVVDDTPGTGTRAVPSDLSGLRVLLAEDGPDNQRLVSFVLKKAGAEVTVAENGKLALAAALAARDEARPFDVILMDMQMPVMDGYEATRLLRQKGFAGPVIALTAHAMAGDRKKCIKAGCDGYASKPIHREKLIETIRAHVKTAAIT
jgi:signal transduction histidine kinase/ActR/RegA family two-component response regulator